MKQKETALVCFSGGQDSTTCLFWALSRFESVETVCFVYGQKHVKEVEVANSLTDFSMEMDREKPEDTYPNTFVPGRNMVFLTFAAIKAFQKGIRHLVTGVSQADFSGYPDCRDTFIRSLNVSLNLAMDTHFEIHTPLMWRDKEAVWRLSDELGVFDLVRNETLTCYNGIIADGCGECPACKLRKRGLNLFLKHRDESK